MATTTYTHKFASVFLRFIQFVSAIVVVVILARFFYYLGDEHVHANGRLVYAMVVAGMSLLYSFFLCPPFTVLFHAFPFDFVLGLMWLIAFCLLITVSFYSFITHIVRLSSTNTRLRLPQKSGTNACSSWWFRNYWGYYWGYQEEPEEEYVPGWGYTYTEPEISSRACPLWRTVLAFSFIAFVFHVLSGILVSHTACIPFYSTQLQALHK